ncbi:MAG: hypothetical protein HZB19_16150 [Chloroflexi bacterium]|nr:hypothetical protein [Chloroflexota bacterium]
MDTATARKILTQKEPETLYDAVQPVLKDAKLRGELVEGSFAKNETYRYNCVRVLFRAIEAQPGLFYPYWNRFAEGIDSPNGFHRSVGAQAIAHLASVDADCRLDPIFDHYLTLLDDTKVMVSHYFLETIGLIYQARPDFQSKIIACLLNIEETKHPLSRKDLLKADVINAFDQLFDTLSPKDKKRVIAFAKDQLECSSSKTRKAAKEFGKKRE